MIGGQRGRRQGVTALALMIAIAAAGMSCEQTHSVVCPSGRVCAVGHTCALKQDVCISNSCGNGIKEGDEACDDGDILPGGDCNETCTSDYSCGNGKKDVLVGEVCDDGKDNGLPGKCSADCRSDGRCGNGITDEGEECDFCVAEVNDGSSVGDEDAGVDATPGLMSLPDGGEADASSGNICRLHITESRTCNSTCTVSRCGDGQTNHAAGEECDTSGESVDCDFDCTVARCGDGTVNRARHEECDVPGGAETATCNGIDAGEHACHFSICGDNFVNKTAQEQCDESTGADTNLCNGSEALPGVACHFSKCGDGYENHVAGEECDVLGGGNGLGKGQEPCNGAGAGALGCKVAKCGDGFVNGFNDEQCDSGTIDTPACNGNTDQAVMKGVACHAPSCGDGYTNEAVEICDNLGGADSMTCNGARAPEGVRCHQTRCGDGYVNATVEDCDDGNATAGDGCTNCKKDGGFDCSDPAVSPTACSAHCGDGQTKGEEDCDDGNQDACGQCGAGCQGVQRAAPATGSITTVSATLLHPGDSFTLSDGLHPPIVFEFNDDGIPTSTRVLVPLLANTANEMAVAIVETINDVGAALSITAAQGKGNFKNRVLLTNGNFGSAGNVSIVTTPAQGMSSIDKGFQVDGMADGHGYDCPAGTGCTDNRDCGSGSCIGGQCQTATCSDRIQNQLETGVDCGGPCKPCENDGPCIENADCHSGNCKDDVCGPSCTDTYQDGDETDADCGGSCNTPCQDGKMCGNKNSNCQSGVCTGSVCQVPSCNDQTRNGDETGMDCGGSKCAKCPGSSCSRSTDCASGHCSSPDAGTCQS